MGSPLEEGLVGLLTLETRHIHLHIQGTELTQACKRRERVPLVTCPAPPLLCQGWQLAEQRAPLWRLPASPTPTLRSALHSAWRCLSPQPSGPWALPIHLHKHLVGPTPSPHFGEDAEFRGGRFARVRGPSWQSWVFILSWSTSPACTLNSHPGARPSDHPVVTRLFQLWTPAPESSPNAGAACLQHSQAAPPSACSRL